MSEQINQFCSKVAALCEKQEQNARSVTCEKWSISTAIVNFEVHLATSNAWRVDL